MLDYRGTECRLKEKINNTAGRSPDLNWPRILKYSKYETFLWRAMSHVPLWIQVLQGCPIYQMGFSFCVSVCSNTPAHTGALRPWWTMLPGQALVGTALGSFQGHWLGGWPSLSSSVSAGCHFSVMEMIFPLNLCPGLQGWELSAPVKRK